MEEQLINAGSVIGKEVLNLVKPKGMRKHNTKLT